MGALWRKTPAHERDRRQRVMMTPTPRVAPKRVREGTETLRLRRAPCFWCLHHTERRANANRRCPNSRFLASVLVCPQGSVDAALVLLALGAAPRQHIPTLAQA